MDANKTVRTVSSTPRMDTKKLAILGMMCAVAYVVMLVSRIPIVLFLKYDAKDVIIAIAAFIYGPMSGLLISVVVSIVEMLSVSDTGIWGLVMNVLSTCAFVCPAAWLYQRKHTLKGAVLGLVTGGVLMIIVMILWNYLITPIYLGYPRDAVVDLLLPAFLPFNALKAGLNATITILLYKPVVTALRKAKLLPQSQTAAPLPESGETTAPAKKNYGVTLLALVVLATLILLALVLSGKI